MNPIQEKFVKTILHRCVDLGWTAKRLCAESGVSQSGWSEIRRGKKSPSMETLVKLTHAVGLEFQFRFEKKSNTTETP